MTLQEMILALMRHWRLIVLGAVLTGGVALGVSYLMPPTYEATATVAMARTTVTVNFDPRLKTTPEEEALLQLRRTQDLEARRKALAALVANAAIAQRVLEQLKDRLPENLQEPNDLMETVEGSTEGDAVLIKVRTSQPDVAAEIANAWAKEYERLVNQTYGNTAAIGMENVVREADRAKGDYEAAQSALEAFLAENRMNEINRQIEEKKAIVASLVQGRKDAIEAVVKATIEARSKIVSAYVNTLSENLLFAFHEEQQAKKELLSKYFSAELENRLLALEKDRELRKKLFASLVDAEIQAKTAVFQNQIEDRIQKLADAYAQRRTLEQLLENAQALLQQIETASLPPASVTSGLSILLLKAQAFASTGNLPSKLELSLDSIEGLSASPQEQVKDLEALIGAIKQYIQELNQSIKEQSIALLKNEGYDLLDVSLGGNEEDPLSQTIVESYQKLFDFGQLSRLSQKDYLETPLLKAIQTQYPDLFQIGEIAKLSDLISAGSPLATSASDASKKLLQLQGLEEVPNYTSTAEPLTQAIVKLEDEIDALEAQLEAEQARKKELVRARDLAWEKYKTLAAKVAEVDVASSITGTEVRFAAPALAPRNPVSPKKLLNGILGGFVGLMLALGLALLSEHPAINRLRGETASSS